MFETFDYGKLSTLLFVRVCNDPMVIENKGVQIKHICFCILLFVGCGSTEDFEVSINPCPDEQTDVTFSINHMGQREVGLLKSVSSDHIDVLSTTAEVVEIELRGCLGK